MKSLPRIGAVVLTYNSEADLPASLNGLREQEGVDLRLILVDNASALSSRKEMEETFEAHFQDGLLLDLAEASRASVGDARAVFIRNDKNAGYSAGNNIGARLAESLGCEGMLILNPDVRISDPRYVAKLWSAMKLEPLAAVAASSVRNLNGVNENPMKEPGFWEEFLWPARMMFSARGFQRGKMRKAPASDKTIEKVSGSCFLICADALEEIGYFDEGVFLYCEEAILSAQLKARGRTIAYTTSLEVLHAHDTSMKGDPTRRFAAWSRSRGYFLHNYSGYGTIALGFLTFSRFCTIGLVGVRQVWRKLRQPPAQANR